MLCKHFVKHKSLLGQIATRSFHTNFFSLNPQEEFAKVVACGRTTSDNAMKIYDSLEPVNQDFMIGRWKGAELLTGHPMDGLLEVTGWYGKMFVDTENVHPLLFYSSNGKDLFAVNPARMVMAGIDKVPRSNVLKSIILAAKPLIQTKDSKARLRMTEYRGKVSATMVYDEKPINDVFRKVDDNTLLGVMDAKGMDQPYFFILRRDNTPVQIDV